MVISRYRNTVLMLMILAAALSFLRAQSVSLSADRTLLRTGEQLRLTFTFENIRNAPRSVNLDLHEHFSIAGGPYTSVNYSMVNGKTSYTNTISYDLVPKKTGMVRIPAYEFEIKNATYRTQPFEVTVRKAPDPQKAEEDSDMPGMFIEVRTPRDTLYQGETFTVLYRLYTGENILNYTAGPVATLEGFIVDRFELNKDPYTSAKVIGGRRYITADIAFLTLTATETGRLGIPLKVFRVSRERKGQGRSLFDDPFFGINAEKVRVAAPADTVTVLPLPPCDAASFTGAIGDFAMHVELDTSQVYENQAAGLRVDLIGHGNMEHFTFPKPGFPGAFEVFEPKVRNAYELNKEDYKGTRVWEYVLIPSTAGKFSLPDVEFTYFSPRRKAYRTLRTAPGDLRVLSHDELAGDYASSGTPDPVRMLSEDIRFIHMQEGKLRDPSYDPLHDPRNHILYYISLGFVLLFILAEYLLALREQNMKKIRYRNALKNATREFRKIGPESSHAEVLRHVERGLSNYLEDKGLGREAHPAVADVMKSIETFKYAPGMVSHVQLDKLREEALNIIEEIERA